ncbi:MAG: GHKL domain-containing protein [Nostocaceae cyanobacterium]|nr:GHKL domain-containing protein [Nostocaceae cyanobacterium]
MKQGTKRVSELVVSLRNFSRLDEAEIKDVDIHEGIESTLLILHNRIKHDILLVKDYGNLPLISCYPAQLNQVFMNIISNAIDALLEQTIQSPQIVIHTEVITDNRIQIQIQDNGSGIPAELKSKIFDPFFTTKPIGQGTGLGLSISYQIIEKHQGQVEVFSQPAQGTKFVITLPIKST